MMNIYEDMYDRVILELVYRNKIYKLIGDNLWKKALVKRLAEYHGEKLPTGIKYNGFDICCYKPEYQLEILSRIL